MEYLTQLFTLFAAVLLLVFYYFNYIYSYWKNRNVIYIKPTFPFGSLGNPLLDKNGISIRLKEAYDEIKAKGGQYGGFYIGIAPTLLATNPESVKIILHTAFDYFQSNGNIFDEEKEPLSAHLLNLDGQRWKHMRAKLTPTFTSGKMKIMFQTILNCGEQLETYISKSCREKTCVDIRETSARFTTDVIGSCVFGLECNSFKNPNAEFRIHGKKIFQPTLKSVFRRLGNITCPSIIKTLKVALFDAETTDFFMNVIKKVVDYRKTNSVTRNDFIQILLNMQEAGFTVEEIAAQAFAFFAAGFETSSTTMTFCLYELAHNQEVQENLREEINYVIKKHDGKITYEGIMEMTYLQQVINETLRKHPPLPVIKRICTKDYQLSNGVLIQKGIIVFVSVLGLHRDEEFYPNPGTFDPERFSEKNKKNIPQFAYIPFGEGPRICIGLRFGLLQTTLGLCLLLKDYKVSPHASLKYPIEYESRTFILSTKQAVLLNFVQC